MSAGELGKIQNPTEYSIREQNRERTVGSKDADDREDEENFEVLRVNKPCVTFL